ALEMLKNQPTVSYTPGTYQSKYSEQIDAILNDILSSNYQGYDANSDPTYSQYKKSYLREADRTEKDVLGQYANMNGGMSSTAAISAASQAGNNFKAQLADKIPELEAAAYERYLSELSGKRQNLSDLTALEEMEYGRFTEEESRKLAEYQQAQSEYDTALNRLLQAAEISQSKEDSEASRALSQIGYGVMPSQAGLKALGIDEETAKSLMAASEGSGLSEETMLKLLEYSIKYGVAPSEELLDYFGQSAQWGNGVIDNAVASANGEDLTPRNSYELIAQKAATYTDDDQMYEYLTQMVKEGEITMDDAGKLYAEYAKEYASDREAEEKASLTEDDIALQDRKWTLADSGGNNWFGGIDGDAKATDQFGNTYTMDELFKALKKSGLSAKEAEAYVLLIQAKIGAVKS
ncbi:MAG: hypothetical protein ACI3YH_01385, partial [Eubacteriales bacterium]